MAHEPSDKCAECGGGLHGQGQEWNGRKYHRACEGEARTQVLGGGPSREIALCDLEELKKAWDWADDHGCDITCELPRSDFQLPCTCGRIAAQEAIEGILHTAAIID